MVGVDFIAHASCELGGEGRNSDLKPRNVPLDRLQVGSDSWGREDRAITNRLHIKQVVDGCNDIDVKDSARGGASMVDLDGVRDLRTSKVGMR